MKKLILLIITVVVLTPVKIKSQVFVNRLFQDFSANPVYNPVLSPFGINWSKSITNTSNELITVGHTTVSGQGENLFLEKRGGGGSLIFSISKNTGGTNNEYGIALIEPTPGGDIYVCGVTDNGTTNNFDILIYKYSSNGILLDSAQFDNGGLNYNDFASSISIDANGNVIVGGSTQTSNGTYDYLVIKYQSNLNFLSSNTYDYNGLDDIAIGAVVNSMNGDVSIIGASASTSITAEYVVAVFNGTSLSYLSDERSSIPGTTLDQPIAFCKNTANDIFITGKVWNSTNFDIKTIKISSTYSLTWSSPIDVNGFDDAGNSITVDPQNGNVIIGGYATNSNNVKELVCLRLDATTGTVIAGHEQMSENSNGDSFIKALATNTLGDVYFVAEEKGNSGKRQVIIGKIKGNGQQSWQRKVMSAGYNIYASDIETSGDGICIISILDSSVTKYIETKYAELELDTSVMYSTSGKPIFKKNELIVRFMPTVLDSAAIDNKIGTASKTFANLNYFLTPTAYSQFMSAINDHCAECPIKAIKIFPSLNTTFTTTTSRLGQNVAVPDFWATLLLQFPINTNLQQVSNDLASIPTIVAYSHPNFIATLPQISASATAPSTVTSPTDPHYPAQHSLHNFGVYPNADINIDDAWGIVQSGGSSFVKGGIMDSGIEWRHEDFGYVNSNPNTSKIINGWDFNLGIPLKSMPNPDSQGHGTAVAGIIGAIKGNTLGIKGIAGGDYYGGNTGVSLYSLGFFSAATLSTTLNFIADGIVTSALASSSTFSYAFGLHFQNNSWTFDSIVSNNYYTDTNIVLLTEAVHHVNRLGVTFVISRGNFGTNSPSLPATLHDDWVLTVGGTGTDGDYNNGITNGEAALSFGRNVDIAAPSSSSLILTTRKTTPTTFTSYNSFNNTSAAAPHVSGVVALLMSYHNSPTNTNDYNNLSPEDCEEIIQRSASTPTTSGITLPNQYIGYGRLNAGHALRMIEKPYKTLYHFGTNSLTAFSFTKTVYSNGDTISLTEFYKNYDAPRVAFQKGKYFVKTFEINAIVNHNINSSTDSVMCYWARPSSSFAYPLFDLVSGKLQPREKLIINNLNATSATLKGYVYQVWDASGNYKGWIPCDTSFSALFSGTNTAHTFMEYSILTKNTALGVIENKKEFANINLFPNPSSSIQILEINSQIESYCTIDLYDIMGRLLKKVYANKIVAGKYELNLDVANLPNSLYVYYIKINDRVTCIKFIKE